jgi:hypothetical protein
MKSADLIKLLQDLDPTGEVEVLVKNSDITAVYKVEAYYDGRAEKIFWDGNKKVLGRYYNTGEKIVIKATSLYELATMDENFLIETVDDNSDCMIAMAKFHGMQVRQEVELEDFINWAKEKYPEFSAWTVAQFYMNNFQFDEPLPDELLKRNDLSKSDKYHFYWDGTVIKDFYSNGLPALFRVPYGRLENVCSSK